jgi:hypothetical protein
MFGFTHSYTGMSCKNFTLIAILFVSVRIFSQDLIPRFSVNASGLRGNSKGSFQALPSLGIATFYGDKDDIQIRLEYALSLKGSCLEKEETQTSFLTLYNQLACMLTVPVYQSLNISAGFKPEILIFGRMRTTSGSNSKTEHVSNELSRFDYTTFAGLDYMYKENLMIGLRYNHSFVPFIRRTGRLYDGDRYFWRGVEVYLIYDIFNK